MLRSSAAPSPLPMPPCGSLAESVRPTEARSRVASCRAGRPGRGGGRRREAWSMIVPNSDSVPSSLSKSSSRRVCWGQSASAATRTLQKPPPLGPGSGRRRSSSRASGPRSSRPRADTACSSVFRSSVPRWIGSRVARVDVAAGVEVMAVAGGVGGAPVHGGAASSGTCSAAMLVIAWWLKRKTSSSASVASWSSPSSHWNCGSSTLPSAEGPMTPPSETVSRWMKRSPGFGLNE